TQAHRTPDAIAVSAGEEHLTYAELNQWANSLARALIGHGVGIESYVAVYIERSPAMLVALLATLKASAAYIPLEPGYPAARLDFMAQDAVPDVLLFDSRNALALPAIPSATQCIDVAEIACGGEDANPARKTGATNAVYAIYTSGSTGRPKGAINTQEALINRLTWMQDTYQLTVKDQVLQKTPLGFDVSGWEIFWPLLNGATLVLAPPGAQRDSAAIVDLIMSAAITVTHFVPPMLNAFLEEPTVDGCTSLRHIICSGEALAPTTVALCAEKLPGAGIHNLYGPTEAAIDVSSWACNAMRDSHGVPIGKPIYNTRLHVLDDALTQVPIGAVGELFIGGLGLARGYLNRPGLTAERFIPDPFVTEGTSGVLYRTGDLARFRDDGAIEYLGRIDHQVKIRGVRIELGDIENAIRDYAQVGDCVVVVRETPSGEPALVAYLTTPIGSDDELMTQLSKHLKSRLPEPMIPATIIGLEALPLSPNGKVDRNALPAPVTTRDFIPPVSETEIIIAQSWSSILGVPEISKYDHFFELGGHSLSATRVNSRLRGSLNIELPLRSLFDHPVLAELAEHIDSVRPPSADNSIAELDLG
ncbi:MAG: amino acid adenylation domain-containing protein, partial [Pseudomonadota bacterium]